jgi:hypothetical protein
MDKILVFDNFLNQDELTMATSIISKNKWMWGHVSNNEFGTPFWNMALNECDFFSKELKNVIEKHFNKKFNLKRVYANGQTFGQDGDYHPDDTSDNTYTFCLYLTDIKKKFTDVAGGYLYFKLPGYKYNICFEPLFNRGIFFPSNYFHKSCAFNRYVMDLRICVAWKLEEVINN